MYCDFPMAEILSLADPEAQQTILRYTACPTSRSEFTTRLSEAGFVPDKSFEVNVYWLVKSGELIEGNDFYLANGNTPHQLAFSIPESPIPQSA